MNLFKKMLAALVGIATCSGCNISLDENPKPDSYLNYKVDGALKSSNAEATYYTQDNSMLIDGGKDPDDLSIFIDTNIRVGTFPIGKMSGRIAVVYVNWNNSIFFNSDTGTLVISSYDGQHITGTFKFTASSDAKVRKYFTGGQFSANVEQGHYSNDTHDCPDSSYYDVKRERLMLRKRQVYSGKFN